jgi:hypothetical protein
VLHQSTQSIEISTAESTIKTVSIFDTCGKLIAARHGNATNKVVFPVGSFCKGIYILQVNGQIIKFLL